MKEERLHKILAARGVASRRACEAIISSGRVSIGSKIVTELGTKVSPDADIRVDGRPIHEPRKAYYILNKPRGYVTTLHDDRGRKSVGGLLGRLRTRVYPVGRLDAETEGLLLVTNDGEMTNVLTHPRFQVERMYLVTIRGSMDQAAIERLRSGIFLKEGKVSAGVKLIRSTRETTRLEITIHQGINRQVRRMCAAVGYEVKRLERVRFGPLRLLGLPRGGFRMLTQVELQALKRYCARVSNGAHGLANGAKTRETRGVRPKRK